MKVMPDILGVKETEFLINLVVALVCGFIIGYERERKEKPAGISTQTLVVGAAMLFAYLSHNAGGEPTRIAAQIVTGIGFLGAGLIIKSETSKRVDNVTTAASIWYSAAVGMAIGFGYYFIAIAASVYAVLVSLIPTIPNSKYKKR